MCVSLFPCSKWMRNTWEIWKQEKTPAIRRMAIVYILERRYVSLKRMYGIIDGLEHVVWIIISDEQ